MAELGRANLEGFAPKVDIYGSTSILQPVKGEVNAKSGHTSLPITYVITVNVPTGFADATGPADDFEAIGVVGETNAVGFAPTVTCEKTERPSVGITNAAGFAGVVGKVNVVTGSVGEINAVGATASFARGQFVTADETRTHTLSGFAPSVTIVRGSEISVTPFTGKARADAGTSPTLTLIKFFEGMTPGEAEASGNVPRDVGARNFFPSVGVVNAEGLAPAGAATVTTIQAQTGEVNVTYAEVTPTLELWIDIAGVDEGATEAEGFGAGTDIERVGGIFRNPQLGVVNADGSIAAVKITRTARPGIHTHTIEGFAGTKASTATIVSIIGYLNATGQEPDLIVEEIPGGRWVAIAAKATAWARVNAQSSTWSATAPKQTVWTKIEQEAS